MKITILVGNGFDLSLGMKTSAKDILTEFIAANKINNNFNDDPAGRLAQTIKNEGIDKWSDFELKFGEYSSKVSAEIDADVQIDEYINAKRAIENILVSRIKEQDIRIKDDYLNENAHECIFSMTKWLSDLSQDNQNTILSKYNFPVKAQYKLFCFNYTSALDKIVESGKDILDGIQDDEYFSSHTIDEVLHVHGSLGRTCVWGVDNDLQITSETLRTYPGVISNIVKPNIQEFIASNDAIKAMEDIKSSDIVMIYGMSLGQTDQRWWKALVDWLKDNESHFLIIFTRNCQEVDSPGYQKSIDHYRKKFIKATGLNPDEYQDIVNRIFIVNAKNIFTIKNELHSPYSVPAHARIFTSDGLADANANIIKE